LVTFRLEGTLSEALVLEGLLDREMADLCVERSRLLNQEGLSEDHYVVRVLDERYIFVRTMRNNMWR